MILEINEPTSVHPAEYAKEANRAHISLNKLTDQDLLSQTKSLVIKERERLVEILNHLKEIDLRKLYLEIGYPSLWAYCTQELQYSEAAAQRRIEAMRAIREMPILEKKIESGQLSITNVAKAQAVFRRAEKTAINRNHEEGVCGDGVQSDKKYRRTAGPDKLELFFELENKTQKQTEQILAQHFPEQVAVQEKIRILSAEASEVRFTMKRELLEKLETVKSLVSHAHPNPGFAELIEIMADFIISKKNPLTNQPPQRRSNKAKNTTAHDVEGRDAEGPRVEGCDAEGLRVEGCDAEEKSTATNSAAKKCVENGHSRSNRRQISIHIRREVWRAAGGTCEFTDLKIGRRCHGRHQLEIDHITPVAFGGTNDRENLRLYCRMHNAHAAREATLG